MRVNFRLRAGGAEMLAGTDVATQVVRVGWWDLLRALLHCRRYVEVEAVVSHSTDIVGLTVQVAEWWRDPLVREQK
jgi:hypothetical protein